MGKSTTKKRANETFLQKREELKRMSAEIQKEVKRGDIASVNDGLKHIYGMEGHEKFKTFEEWQAEGRRIIKGEQAMMLWGKPRTATNEQGEQYSYYPVKYVFSDKQVREGGAEYNAERINRVELVRRESPAERMKISSSEEGAKVARMLYNGDLTIYESTWAILLDRSNVTIGVAKISQGSVSGTVVDVRLILKYAIDTLASGIILVHNHPSGNLAPSSQDSAITRKVKEAARWMDVILLDHLILTEDSYYSFADNGII